MKDKTTNTTEKFGKKTMNEYKKECVFEDYVKGNGKNKLTKCSKL